MALEPHGGCGLVNRFTAESEKTSFIKNAYKLKTYTISNAELSVLYRIADGTLSPLEGPMGKDEFFSVLHDELICRNGKKYAWTIPIIFLATKEEAKNFEKEEVIAIKTVNGAIVATLQLTDIYKLNKNEFNKAVYSTDRSDHPGPRILSQDHREYALGGRVSVFPEIRSSEYAQYILYPRETRELFRNKGWNRIVAFQTRNPLHRAHEYAIVYALERLTKDGYFAGAVLNPLIGETKKDDIPADVRMRTYKVLIEDRLIGDGDKDEGLWMQKGYDLTDQVLLIALDMRMFYAGPKEAIMHAIYRQNFGFTDIIVGRRHADAPFDDGKPLWGDFDAQKKFDSLRGELLIKPFNVGYAAFLKELGRVGSVDDFKEKGYTEITISGQVLRKKLENEESIDERIMRKPVSEILYEAYRHNIGAIRADIKSKNIVWHDHGITKEDREKKHGHKSVLIWLTGLPCSGKSTIAQILQSMLFKIGCKVYVLDGDNIRHGLNKDLGFSPKEREENIRRIAEVAKLFTNAGMITIAAFVSPYRKDRDMARSLFERGNFIEVFVNASLGACESRDTKGLYKKARLGEIKEFTGVSAPYEEPSSPEIVLPTEIQSETESTWCILEYLTNRDIIEKDTVLQLKSIINQ